jgi:hypothetical protein
VIESYCTHVRTHTHTHTQHIRTVCTYTRTETQTHIVHWQPSHNTSGMRWGQVSCEVSSEITPNVFNSTQMNIYSRAVALHRSRLSTTPGLKITLNHEWRLNLGVYSLSMSTSCQSKFTRFSTCIVFRMHCEFLMGAGWKSVGLAAFSFTVMRCASINTLY